MRLAPLAALVLSLSLAPLASAQYAWAHSYSVTIDHTKVGTVSNTDQSNFPLLISGTYTQFKDTGHSGFVNNVDLKGFPIDLVATSDSGCSTILPIEWQTYDNTTGAVNLRVKVPTVSHSADTVIYLCVGNSAVTAPLWVGYQAWDSNFAAVLHLESLGASTTTHLEDATFNRNHGVVPSNVTDTAGKVGRGATCSGSNNIQIAENVTVVGGGAAFSISAWFQITGHATAQAIIAKFNGAGTLASYELHTNTSGNLRCYFTQGASTFRVITGSTVISNNTWTHGACVYDGAHLNLYLNGVSDATPVAVTGNIDNPTPLNPEICADGSGDALTGKVDEPEISLSARTNDYYITRVNNENSPSTFYAVSSDLGATAAASGIPKSRIFLGQ